MPILRQSIRAAFATMLLAIAPAYGQTESALSPKAPPLISMTLETPSLRIGDDVVISIRVTAPAFVYCYYEYFDEGRPVLIRIYPSRFAPNNFLTPERNVQIPPVGRSFNIVPRGPDEQLACVATAVDYETQARAPDILLESDLYPIGAPWDGVAAAIAAHLEIDEAQTSSKTSTRPYRRPMEVPGRC